MTKEQAIEKLISREEVIYGRRPCVGSEISAANDGMVNYEISRSQVIDVKKLAKLLANHINISAEELLEIS